MKNSKGVPPVKTAKSHRGVPPVKTAKFHRGVPPIKTAKSQNFKIASLGPLTLRGETAAIVATYLVSNL